MTNDIHVILRTAVQNLKKRGGREGVQKLFSGPDVFKLNRIHRNVYNLKLRLTYRLAFLIIKWSDWLASRKVVNTKTGLIYLTFDVHVYSILKISWFKSIKSCIDVLSDLWMSWIQEWCIMTGNWNFVERVGGRGRESRVPQIVITATQICFAASALLNW